MISIKNFLTKRKQILIKDSVLKLLFRRNLSSNEVNILNSHIRNLLIANNEPDSRLYIYTYHNLDNEFKQHSVLLRIQCTANNAYIQYHEDVPYININDNTTVFYSSKHLYLTTNNIITAIGTLNNNHISWDNTLVLNNYGYMKLPFPTILPRR